jgi:hypothetical protein
MHTAPLLLIILIGLLLGLLTVGFFKSRRHQTDDALAWVGDDLFLKGLLTLAAFVLGVFVATILLGLH